MQEILLRLIDENGNLVLPMAFISAAERYHLMSAIDQWVISTFLQKYKILLQNSPTSETIYSINLSGTSLNDPNFSNFLQKQLSQTSIPLSNICFEVAETTVIANLIQVTNFIHLIKSFGCRFAIDNFGIR